MSKKDNPKIILAGAGPGDPELISLKALNAIKSADVILYDALVNKELLQHAKENVELIFVGKRKGQHSLTQDEINKLLVEQAFLFGSALRLKGGDPFVFGRGFEEIEYANKFGLETEYIPGISSSISVPGLAGIPVTHRGVSESFWVITGTTKENVISGDVFSAAKINATVVILMGLSKLNEIVEVFKNEGKTELPVAIIQNGSLPSQKIVVGTIQTIVNEVKEKNISAPAVIVIGEVVKQHDLFKEYILQSGNIFNEGK